LDLACITLATKVEHDQRDAKELGVAAHICWHGNFCFLSVCRCELFKAFRRITDSSNRNVLYYHVSVFKIRLCMFGTEVYRKLFCLTTKELSLSRFDSIVSVFVLKADFLRILGFVAGPVEGEMDWSTVTNFYFAE
jgi:hypothetical protein